MELHNASAMPFKSFPENGQLKCYPRYAIFSYRTSHCSLFRKPWSHSLLHDISPVTLWPSAVGIKERR